MELDRNGLEVLTEEECLQLLARTGVARLGLSVGGLPVIVPVNFTLVGRDIVLRTVAGAKLDAARHGDVVCVQADQADFFAHEGWSVLATGRAREVTDPDEFRKLRALPVARWAKGGGAEHFVSIRAELISGRRLTQHAPVGGWLLLDTGRAVG